MADSQQDLARRLTSPSTLMVAGAVLLPLGLLVIVLGWWGVAHSPFEFEQNSYLVSGGIAGLGLLLIGGFLYFGAWLARLAERTRADSDRLVAAIESLVSGAPTTSSGTSRGAVSARLVATPTGTMLHRADCAVVASRTDVREVSATTPGLRPCRLCDPLGAP